MTDATEQLCSHLPNVTNGYLTPTHTPPSAGTKLDVICNAGFQLEHDVVCTEHGSWDPPQVVCQPTYCSQPPAISHGLGTLVPNTSAQQASVNYSCNAGFELKGTDTLYCTDNGTWIGPVPHCLRVSCGPPPHFPNGICGLSQKEYVFEDTLRLVRFPYIFTRHVPSVPSCFAQSVCFRHYEQSYE